MTKKVVWGLVVLGLVGILVAGAVVRTAAKAGDAAATGGRGSGEGTGTGQAQVDEWVTIEASVVSVDDVALVALSDGEEEIVVEGRPWLFAQEQGFTAQPGDCVTLTAFYEEGAVKVGTIADATTGQTVRLRDESGRPGWARRGRRDGQ